MQNNRKPIGRAAPLRALRLFRGRYLCSAAVPVVLAFLICVHDAPRLQAQMATSDRLVRPGWWPTKSTAFRSEFMGPAACAECHSGKSSAWKTTSMAHASAPVSQSEILRVHDKLIFQRGGYTYTIATTGEKSNYSVSDGTRETSVSLDWSFGVGRVAQTYLFEQRGAFHEARVSYYSNLQALDLTVGHSSANPESFEKALGRTLSAEEARLCFGCHTTASSTDNRFDPGKLIPGVTCEACHGPGLNHVTTMKAGMDDGKNPIFDPRQLKPVDSVDFCGTCHGAWWDVRMQSMTGVITVRSQPYRLENSRCWGKGDARITCIACHDPHRPLVRAAASYDQRCLSCHLPSVDAKPGPDHPGAACKVSTKNCVTCHMPEVEVPELHYKFTDHQIRIVRPGAEFPN